MSKKDDLLHNNEQEEQKAKKTKSTKTTSHLITEEKPIKVTKKSEDNDFTNDGVIDLDLYHQITSTLFNSLSNPIVRNEIKVNENVLKYTELQISNLFFLESALSKELSGKKLAKEFLQLTANITDLALTVNKSSKKTAIEILEDRNLLIVTIINSCKGIERESLDKLQTVNSESFKKINDQIAALTHFTTDEEIDTVTESRELKETRQESTSDFNQENQTNNFNQPQTNNLNNMRNLNNVDMANLSKLGVLPQHPATNPNFYPYLSKPKVIPKLKKILSGMLLTSVLFIIITVITSVFVKGPITIVAGGPEVQFVLSKANNWLILVMTMVLYAAFAYAFLKPPRLQRDKYHLSYFMLGLLLFWLIVTIAYFIWQTSDGYYHTYFTAMLGKEEKLNPDVIAQMKDLPNFMVFHIFSIVTSAVSILPLLIVIVLMLINPRLDRNKVMRANAEYQNAIAAALSGQKYDMDQSLFDKDEPKLKKKSRKKAQFSGWF
ncbi:MAG: hypothetical protein REH79_02780 [Spiroplasma sp.]|nr:hypothetical protein [Spiroplasma sp.]